MDAFMKKPSEHTHAPDPDRVHVMRVKDEIKGRSASSDETTSTILFVALRTIPLNVAAGLPTNDALMQTIRRERQATQLDENGHLPLVFHQTDCGKNFVSHEDDSMVIFTCDKNPSVLKECPHWFMDGTFSICPKSFYQLFTVHGMYSLQIIPLVYVVLIGKNSYDYDQFFEQLLMHYGYEPESILIDDETATRKSTKSIFPQAVQIGNMNAKKLMALAFLLVSDVTIGYSAITDDFDEEDYALLDYFERVWTGQKKGRGWGSFNCIYSGNQRNKPKFSLHLWNTYERVINDLPRSNNAVERWHNAFNNRVSIKNLSITKLAKCIIREQSRFEIDIQRLRTGEQPGKKKKVYVDLDIRLKRIAMSYNVDNIEEYLYRIAVNLKLNN
ncbi:unnamed protein product [Adineta ricciae]|uniref:MULE transposase domain-containing protein n=1 Tax=Adineta ricciae TaxID=249248 RepID=A0A816GG50_ADIRI|nr:unnamed protein product [Adineta ricciae]CAF1674290.1 unnamed protein product [Adineta ricciae]